MSDTTLTKGAALKSSELLDSLLNDEGLNEREVAFLNVLFDEHKGSIQEAMTAVGYPKGTSQSDVTRKLNKHIKERSKEHLISSSAKASISLYNVLQDPSAVGAKNIIAASKDILDRAGIFKEEGPQDVRVHHMFILPAKKDSEEIDDE